MAGIKFGRKVKIVENYEKLFDKKFYDTLEKDEKEASEFWNEFFLLKANPIELEKIIKQQLITCATSHQSTASNHQSHLNQQNNVNHKSNQLSEDGVDQNHHSDQSRTDQNKVDHQNGHQNGQCNHQTQEIVDKLFDKCNLILEERGDKLKQLNSILSLYVIVIAIVNLKQSKRSSVHCTLKLSIDRLERLNRNLMKLLDDLTVSSNENGKKESKTEDGGELVKLILKLYLCLVCKDEELNENELIEMLASDQLFDQLFRIVMTNAGCNSTRTKEQLNHLSLVLITFIQNYRSNQSNNKSNLFTVKLSLLSNEIALNSIFSIISKEINDFNQEYRREFCDPQAGGQNGGGAMESFFSALTGLILSSNNHNDQSQKFEQTLLHTDKRAILLALYDMIHLNRNFIPFLLTNHSNGEDGKETNNLLINFLEFCSIITFCLKEYFHKGEQLQKKLTITMRLCFIILTCIVEDQFASGIMHDSANVFNKVQIYRSKMRHRPLGNSASDQNNGNKVNRPIAYSILDLMIEFMFSNLRKKHFPIDLYVYANIILKLLCYQIKFECRKEFSWNELWHSLFCLLKYLITNYDKNDLQVKRRSRMLLLANNVVNLFNLFIIFGDTFLHSPIDYDNLYYELLRNHDVFDNLAQLAKHHSVSKKKDEKDAALKVLDSLDNIESIISHFIAKINESKSDPPLSEEEIREIVRNNYDSLSIRVKEDLDIYENYEPEKLFFKKKVLKKVIEQVKASHLTNLNELIIDQQVILQSILNC